jgi:hypothetical protein
LTEGPAELLQGENDLIKDHQYELQKYTKQKKRPGEIYDDSQIKEIMDEKWIEILVERLAITKKMQSGKPSSQKFESEARESPERI